MFGLMVLAAPVDLELRIKKDGSAAKAMVDMMMQATKQLSNFPTLA